MSALEASLLIGSGFVALTAIPGGLALILGLEGERIPLEWLEGTPFDTYLVPGLLLTGAVGGSALLAALALALNAGSGSALAAVAGAILFGYIAVEIRILDQPSAPTATEIVYGALSLVMVGLGLAA